MGKTIFIGNLSYMVTDADLREVRAAWGRTLGCATTLGFGPRYLHSTGQLHKGGPGRGHFLVLLSGDGRDADVPVPSHSR